MATCDRTRTSVCGTLGKVFLPLFLCLSMTGCGLLAVPERITFPHSSMKTVVVLDRETGTPVKNATVTCHLRKHKNWIRPHPWLLIGTNNSAIPGSAPANDRSVSWEAVHDGNGVYTFEPRSKVGWIQVWIPLPLPLGWFLYRSHSAAIEASAPAHDSILVADAMARYRSPCLAGTNALDITPFVKIEDGRTTILLPPSTSAPVK